MHSSSIGRTKQAMRLLGHRVALPGRALLFYKEQGFRAIRVPLPATPFGMGRDGVGPYRQN